MHYPHLVTFTEPTEVRTASGGVTYDYDAVADLTDLPARIVPVQQDDQTERMVLDTDRYTVIVKGDHDIARTMRVISSFLDADLGVIQVQRPVLYRSPATYATIVTAERITAAVESGS